MRPLLPRITIGGVDASAGGAYAGPLGGSILGLLEVDVTVPAASATGNSVPAVMSLAAIPRKRMLPSPLIRDR
jgi:uncharacterized protein (TIGR03437 family)